MLYLYAENLRKDYIGVRFDLVKRRKEEGGKEVGPVQSPLGRFEMRKHEEDAKLASGSPLVRCNEVGPEVS